MFAQMPSRAAKSTISAIFVRSDAPKGPECHFGTVRRYALPGNVPQKVVWTEVRWKKEGGKCPGGAWEAGSGRNGVTHFRGMCRRRPFWRKCVGRRVEKCAMEGAGRHVRRQKERSPRPKVGDTVNGWAGKARTASQSRGHGERLGGKNAHRVPKPGTR